MRRTTNVDCCKQIQTDEDFGEDDVLKHFEVDCIKQSGNEMQGVVNRHVFNMQECIILKLISTERIHQTQQNITTRNYVKNVSIS